MSFSAIPAKIEQHFASNWQNRLPVDYPNLPENHKATDAIWCSFYVKMWDGEQLSLGATAVHKWSGIAVVKIFCRENTGTATARSYAETIRAFMQRQDLTFNTTGKIYLKTPRSDEDQREDYFQITIITPFEARQQFTRG